MFYQIDWRSNELDVILGYVAEINEGKWGRQPAISPCCRSAWFPLQLCMFSMRALRPADMTGENQGEY